MIQPFEWWLLIVGLAVGAGLAWLVLADLHRREEDLEDEERAHEAHWIAATLESQGRRMSPEAVDDVLALHRWYLREPPRQDAGASEEVGPDRDEIGAGSTEGGWPTQGGASDR